MLKFNYVQTKEQYLRAIHTLSKESTLAADTETYALPEWGDKGGALDPHTGRISLVILIGRNSLPFVFDILCLQEELEDFKLLQDLLQSKEYIIFHNGKFDLKFIYSTFGFWLENIRDTMIMSKLIGNATGSRSSKVFGHGYADLCRDYLNVHISGKKDLRQSTWYCKLSARTLENEWWLEKLTYAANDVTYLYELHDIMYKTLTDPLPHSPLTQSNNFSDTWGLDMSRQMQVDFDYIPVIAEMEYTGMPVSLPTLKAYQKAVEDKMNEIAVRLCQSLNLDKPQPNWEGVLMPSPKAFKTLRSSQGLLELVNKAVGLKKIDNVQGKVLKRMLDIIELLTQEKPDVDEESSSATEDIFIDEEEEALYSELTILEESEILSIAPVIKDIIDFKTYSKQHGMGLEKHVNPKTGRIHCSYQSIGAATGRSSCSGPNVQQCSGRVKVIVTMKRNKAWVGTSSVDHILESLVC